MFVYHCAEQESPLKLHKNCPRRHIDAKEKVWRPIPCNKNWLYCKYGYEIHIRYHMILAQKYSQNDHHTYRGMFQRKVKKAIIIAYTRKFLYAFLINQILLTIQRRPLICFTA